MSEYKYIMRTVGGPFPGDRVHPGPWPLPDVLPDPEDRGEYRKVAESQLPEDLPGLIRGAQYEWVPAAHKETPG
jgi:hypothetical protein